MIDVAKGAAIFVGCLAIGALMVLIGVPIWGHWLDIIFAYWG